MTQFTINLLRRAALTLRYSIRAGWLAALGCGVGLSGCMTKPTDDAATPSPEIEVSADDLKALAEGNNEFAIDLYKRVAATTDGNIVLSPFSVRTALAMTYAGARGETAKEMARVLHFNLPPDRLHPAFGAKAHQLQGGDDKPYKLSVANALWGQNGHSFRPVFLELNRKNYASDFREVDFVGDSKVARDIINRWVSDKTRDKIKELLGPDDLSPDTRLVLTNALYFKAAWATPFLTGETKDAMFEVATGERVPVSMMHTQKAPFKYLSADDCEWLELPYKDCQLSMILLLPRQGRLAAVERSLTTSTIRTGSERLQFHRGNVALPWLKASAGVRLQEHLISMGMPLAFSNDADFSGMDGNRGLKIDSVIHQAYLGVDEYGSEAAAATAVPMMVSEFPPFSYTADRPFLFLIRDNRSGSILFSGRVSRPSKMS